MNNSREALQTRILENIIFTFGDRVFGQNMVNRLQFLEAAQWWNREQLEQYRLQALRTLIETVYRDVPLYRELMNDRKIRPRDIHSVSDLSKLPIITKDMLRKGYPNYTTRKTPYRSFEVTTSGSTGRPFLVRKDTELDGWTRASFLLALKWAGWQFGNAHLQLGMTLKRGLARKFKDWFLKCHYVSAFDLTDQQLDYHLELLERHSLQHIFGYPGSVYYLAKRAIERGWNQTVNSVVTWGDNLTVRQREIIEAAFRARVYDTYGCGEGMQVAAQCGVGQTYHLHELDVIVEYLNDEGLPLPPGQPANLILTRLNPGPMPFVRYKVGDVGISGNDRKCECGRHLEILESIEGRASDVIVTPAGNRLIVHYFTGILEWFLEVDSFQIIQSHPGAITIRVVPNKGFSSQTSKRIIAKLQEKGAEDMQIDVELVNEIPLTAGGKRRFVINEIRDNHK